MFKLSIQLNPKTVLSFEDNQLSNIHLVSNLYGSLPSKCNVCNSQNLNLFYRNPKDYNYYGIRCHDCGAQLTFHQSRKDVKNIIGGYYIKDGEKLEKYDPSKKTQNANKSDNDVPF